MFCCRVTVDIISQCTLNAVGNGAPSVSGCLSSQHGALSGCDWGNGIQIWTVAANKWNKQSRTADMEWFSSLGFGRRANISSPSKRTMLRNVSQDLGLGLVSWYDASRGKGTCGLAQDGDRCSTLVNAVMNLRVAKTAGNFLTS